MELIIVLHCIFGYNSLNTGICSFVFPRQQCGGPVSAQLTFILGGGAHTILLALLRRCLYPVFAVVQSSY